MNEQGRILIVEDREDWRKTLVEELSRRHFSVDAVESVEKARQLLMAEIYHVLILDIRLNDSDTSNIDGLKLLEEMDKQGLTDAIQVIMLSAYGTKDRMRMAFRDYKVADFVFKTRFNSAAFIEDVQRVFDRNVSINLDMSIHWSGVSGSEPGAANLKLEMESGKAVRFLEGSPLQNRVAREVDDLLRRLFHDAESILVKPMSPGRSGTVVFEVRPFYPNIGAGSPLVVKCGDVRKILQEYHNFKEYVERLVGGRRCTSVHGLRRTVLLGGLIYSFLGAGDQLEDFGTFYQRSDPAQITQALDRLFLNTCTDWYANASRLQLLNLTEDYQQVLHFTSEKLEKALQQLRRVQRSEDNHLHFEAIQCRQSFKNPLRTVLGKALAFPTYTSPTHGDFNQYNLLVDSEGHIWMIDFQGTGQGHILRDIIGLDSVIRFQLLTSKDASLEERLEMERTLCSISHFSQVSQLIGKFPTDNLALAKAYTTAVYLRALASAHMVRQNPNDDFNEYYAALLYNALNTVRFETLEQEQREHALLSACLLADRLGLAE